MSNAKHQSMGPFAIIVLSYFVLLGVALMSSSAGAAVPLTVAVLALFIVIELSALFGTSQLEIDEEPPEDDESSPSS